MAATTEFSYNLVIYIPRMNTFWGTKEKITEVFHNQLIGKVSRVDIIKKKVTKQRKRERKHVGGDYIRSAHVYFTTWFDTEANRNLQARIMDPEKEARVVVDDPWYWLLLESNRNQDEQRLQRTETIMNIMSYHITLRDEETKAELKKQNEAIQHLQDFCITQGLEIPFWDTRNPPAEEVSSMEALAANTAAKAAEYVLNGEYEDDDEEASLMEAASTATSAAEYVLNEYNEDRHFYPIINEPAFYDSSSYKPGDIIPFRDREGDYIEMVHNYGKEAADKHFSYYYRN
jgi:hypothetical protein